MVEIALNDKGTENFSVRDTQRLGMNIESQSCLSVAFEIFYATNILFFHARNG